MCISKGKLLRKYIDPNFLVQEENFVKPPLGEWTNETWTSLIANLPRTQGIRQKKKKK